MKTRFTCCDRRLLAVVCLFVSALFGISPQVAEAQLTLLGVGAANTGVTATPAFVNEYSSNSTQTNALGTVSSGICSTNSYCAAYAEPTLAGNLGIVTFTYDNGSTSTPTTATATDDKSDSYTCVSGSVDSGSGIWNGACYSPNLTAGAHVVTVALASSLTHVSAKVAQFNNIATASPLDTSSHNNGASSSTATGTALTTTQANDLVYFQVCRLGTPAVTSFTVGSGFTFGTVDINDGCTSEFQIASSAGSVTPSMTMASASTYVTFALAFKAANAGTAPSGMYVAHLLGWGTPVSTSTTTWNFQFPSTGNLLVLDTVGSLTPGAVPTDSTNTWSAAGTTNSAAGSAVGLSLEWYVPNATANATGLISAHTTGGPGDASWAFYDIQNAATAPFVARSEFSCGGSCTSPITQTVVPEVTNGLLMGVGGQSFNTFLTCNPPTSCVADESTYGGQSVSGPDIVWENNLWFHFLLSNPSTNSYSLNLSGSLANNWEDDYVNFLSTTGIGIVASANNQVTTGSSMTVTVPSTVAGDLGVVVIGDFDGATHRTVSSVCFDGTTCATANKMTQVTSAQTTSTNQTQTDVWALLSLPAGKTTLTITFSGAISNAEAQFFEARKGNGGTWAGDGNGVTTNNGTVASSTITGPSITPSAGTPSGDFCAAIATVSNSISSNPASGNSWQFGGNIFTNTGDAATSLLTTGASATNPTWTDASGTFNVSEACWK
jgi:hypothetical protein